MAVPNLKVPAEPLVSSFANRYLSGGIFNNQSPGLANSYGNPVGSLTSSASSYQPLKLPAVNTDQKFDFSFKPQGGNAETPWYQDGDAMSGYAGLAGTFLQAAALPSQMKLAKTQRQGLEQNLRQAKIDSAFRATARANLNAPRLGG